MVLHRRFFFLQMALFGSESSGKKHMSFFSFRKIFEQIFLFRALRCLAFAERRFDCLLPAPLLGDPHPCNWKMLPNVLPASFGRLRSEGFPVSLLPTPQLNHLFDTFSPLISAQISQTAVHAVFIDEIAVYATVAV